VTGPQVVDLHDPATLLAADTAALLPAAALAGAQVRSSAEQVATRGEFDRPRALVVIGANSAVDAALLAGLLGERAASPVVAASTLPELHDTLQAALGWTSSHRPCAWST